jgi:hypothetical protein
LSTVEIPTGTTLLLVCLQEGEGVVARISGLEDHFEAARGFYGAAVDLRKVRVKGSWVVFGRSAGWTCNNVVRFKNARRGEDIDLSTFIHELGHVWEHQTGQAQVLRGLVEQLGRLRGRDPYDYGGPSGAQHVTRLQDLTKESQAMILEEYWRFREGEVADVRGNKFTAEYEGDLRRLVEGAGIGTTPPRWRGLAGAIDTAAGSVVNGVLGLFRW